MVSAMIKTEEFLMGQQSPVPPMDLLVEHLRSVVPDARVSPVDDRYIRFTMSHELPAVDGVVAEIKVLPGGVLWTNFEIGLGVIESAGNWLIQHYAPSKLWMIYNLGSFVARVDDGSLASVLQRWKAGEDLYDAEAPFLPQ